MIHQRLTRAFNRLGAALTLILAAHGAAHAGLVVGDWDPQFGAAPLNGMSWQVRAQVLVPDACSNQPDGVYSTAAGACSNTNPATFKFQSVFLRLFDTNVADPNNFFGVTANSVYFNWCAPGNPDPHCNNFGNYFSASNVRVASGQIVGFDTGSVFPWALLCNGNCSSPADFYSMIPSALGNLFGLRLTTNGPELTCEHCAPTLADAANDFLTGNTGRPDIVSSTAGLRQFLVTYVDDNGQTPKYTDANGNPLGALLDGSGGYLGQATSINAVVSEPQGLLLAFTALAALGAFARRRA